jgi:hypothetical protein
MRMGFEMAAIMGEPQSHGPEGYPPPAGLPIQIIRALPTSLEEVPEVLARYLWAGRRYGRLYGRDRHRREIKDGLNRTGPLKAASAFHAGAPFPKTLKSSWARPATPGYAEKVRSQFLSLRQ